MSYQSEGRRERGDVLLSLTQAGWLLERNVHPASAIGPFAEFTVAVQQARLIARRDMVRAWLDQGANQYRWIPLDDSLYLPPRQVTRERRPTGSHPRQSAHES